MAAKLKVRIVKARSYEAFLPQAEADEREEATELAMDVLLGNASLLGGLTAIQGKIMRRLHAGKANAKFWAAMRSEHPKLDSKTLPTMVARRLIHWQPADELHGHAEVIMGRARGWQTLAKCEAERRALTDQRNLNRRR